MPRLLKSREHLVSSPRWPGFFDGAKAPWHGHQSGNLLGKTYFIELFSYFIRPLLSRLG